MLYFCAKAETNIKVRLIYPYKLILYFVAFMNLIFQLDQTSHTITRDAYLANSSYNSDVSIIIPYEVVGIYI